MGNNSSSGKRAIKQNEEEVKEDAELRRQINFITKCLREHETAVYGIIHIVETQAAIVMMLCSKIDKIVSIKEMNAGEKLDVDSEQIICCHCTTDWQEQTNKLLGSVQSGLRLQSKSLRTTFERLNKNVCHIKEHYKIGDGTPVDNGNDRCCIDYKDSPTMDYEAEYKKLQSQVKSLKQSNDDLESNNTKYARQLQEMKERNKKLIEETEKKIQNEKKRSETNIRDIKEKSKGLQEKIQDMEEKSEGLQGKIQDMEENSKVQEEKIKDIQNEVRELRAKKISLEQDMDDLKQTISVQLFHNLKGGMIPTLLYELKTMLATQMRMKRHEIQFVICQTETDVNPKIPVFVFCINASRLGTDAASAIHNLKVSAKVSILVFHHKDVHALPSQASERVLTEPEFKELGGIFDIAFLADKGIYACDMNHATAVGIENFLRTQS